MGNRFFAPDFWKINVNTFVVVATWIFTMGIFWAKFEARVAKLEEIAVNNRVEIAKTREKVAEMDLFGSTATKNLTSRVALVEVKYSAVDKMSRDIEWIIKGNEEIKGQLRKVLEKP